MHPRIFNNLLSSQPLCFNLFGELQQDLELATQVFNWLSEGRVHQVTDIEFEYAPARSDARYTADRSAFDVYVAFQTPEQGRGFIGIEVKYHENLKVKADMHRDRYDEIASLMACFQPQMVSRLKRPPLQQIWRDHLLAGALLHVDSFDDGFFVFLYPQSNLHCSRGIQDYRACLRSEETFVSWSLKQVVSAIKRFTDREWIDRFHDRYLRFDKIDALLTGV